jgi:hypothetical protein
MSNKFALSDIIEYAAAMSPDVRIFSALIDMVDEKSTLVQPDTFTDACPDISGRRLIRNDVMSNRFPLECRAVGRLDALDLRLRVDCTPPCHAAGCKRFPRRRRPKGAAPLPPLPPLPEMNGICPAEHPPPGCQGPCPLARCD